MNLQDLENKTILLLGKSRAFSEDEFLSQLAFHQIRVQYATTGIYHLISQTKNEQLLEAIALLEPSKQHPQIIKALALHVNTPKNVFKMFLKKGDAAVKEAMADNVNLDKDIARELIKNEKLAEIVAQNIRLDDEMFALLSAYKNALAANETLNEAIQQELFTCNYM